MKNQTQMLTYPSLFETLVLDKAENNSQKIFRYVVITLAGSALITLCAQISIPFYPVPVTMQTFAVILIGLIYGWRLGGITVALYLIEGAIGLPVFAGGKGGMTAHNRFYVMETNTQCWDGVRMSPVSKRYSNVA